MFFKSPDVEFSFNGKGELEVGGGNVFISMDDLTLAEATARVRAYVAEGRKEQVFLVLGGKEVEWDLVDDQLTFSEFPHNR